MGGQNVKNTMLDNLLSLVAPHLCYGCQRPGSALCFNCKYDIVSTTTSGCVLCGRRAARGVCSGHKTAYRQAWVVGDRREVLQRVIDAYKFQNVKAAAKELADLLHCRLPSLDPRTVLLPVPTAAGHIRERGYDHTLLLARYFGMMRGLRVEPMIGRRHSLSQRQADREQRNRQASTAFTLTRQPDRHGCYLIIDDIITTGSTIAAAAELLTATGARVLSVAALARQPLD